MSRSRRLSTLFGAAVAAASVLAPVPAAPGSLPAATPAGAPLADDFADAKKKAEAWYLEELVDLGEWCNKKQAFRQRDYAYEAVLVLDPEHKQARRFLRWSWDRKAKEWMRRRPYKLPSEGPEEIVAEAIQRRADLDRQFVDSQLEVIESFRTQISPRQRSHELELLLAVAPEYQVLRDRLGHVKVEVEGESVWMTQRAVEAGERRAEIAAALERFRGMVPEAENIEPIEPEPTLPVSFSSRLGNKRIRVVGDIDEDEAKKAADFGYLSWDFMPFLFGGQLDPQPNFTYYLLTEPSKIPFITSYPGISQVDQQAYPLMRSGWMPKNSGVGCWADQTKFRLDAALKQTSAMYMLYVYGLNSERGWLVDGAGLYVNQLVLGTRYSYQITITKYDDPTRPVADRPMPDADMDWLDVAAEILTDARPARLAGTLGRDTSKLSVEDIILSYALVKYIREGHGADAMAEIMKRIGSGEESSVVVLEDYFQARIPEIQEDLRVWIKEVGGNDFG